MKAALVVHNPASRRGARVAEALRRLADARGAGTAALHWCPIGELAGLAVPTVDRVIAVGGDGTVNASCEWLRSRGIDAPVAIVPAGTGNNLARGLGLPLAPGPAAELALAGERVRAIDAVAYSGGDDPRERLAVQTLALGFPAEVAERYDELRKRPWFRRLAAPLGPSIYRVLALARIRDQRRRERRGDLATVRIRAGDAQIEETSFAVFIGNERSLGGNFVPCPRAAVDDGLLDICLVRAGTGMSYLKLFRDVARGAHLDHERTILYLQTGEPIEIEMDPPGPLLADGDLWVRSGRFRLQVLPGAFSFVVPD